MRGVSRAPGIVTVACIALLAGSVVREVYYSRALARCVAKVRLKVRRSCRML